jgi:hypothetical protein
MNQHEAAIFELVAVMILQRVDEEVLLIFFKFDELE